MTERWNSDQARCGRERGTVSWYVARRARCRPPCRYMFAGETKKFRVVIQKSEKRHMAEKMISELALPATMRAARRRCAAALLGHAARSRTRVAGAAMRSSQRLLQAVNSVT